MGDNLRLCFLAILTMAGCTSIVTDLGAELEPIAQPLLATDSEDQTAPLPSINQPEPYASIIAQNLGEMGFRFDGNLRDLQIARLKTDQSRLPSFTPGASANVDGSTIAQLGMRQVLFAGGLYEAQFHDADVRAVVRQLELLEAVSKDASSDIDAYLSYHKNLELQSMLTDFSTRLEDLLDLADRRLQGGNTEAQIAASNASVDLASLSGIDVSAPPTDFSYNSDRLPLQVLTSMAKTHEARSALQLAQKSAQPNVVLNASVGLDLKTRLPNRNAGIAIEAEPIAIGGNVDILAAEQNVFLASNELNETRNELQRETQKLVQQIAALRVQSAQSDALVGQASSRLDTFEDRFLAGSSSLSEAAGLVDTLRRSMESSVDVRYRIYDLQRKLAEISGAYWSL